MKFYAGNTEYEYEVEATNSTVLKRKQKAMRWSVPKPAQPKPTPKPSQPKPWTPSARFIGEAEAKRIALADAGLTEAQVTFVKAKLDRDDGRYEYELKFYAGNTEYKYEVDATSGIVLKRKKEVKRYGFSWHNKNRGWSLVQYYGRIKG